MGEIADALKKAKAGQSSRKQSDSAPVSDPEPPTEPDPGSYHEALERSRLSSPKPATSEVSEMELVPARFPGNQIDVEAHRHLAVAIRSHLERISARSLAIVSALRNEGKTTVACNLAVALASLAGEREVALVDLDLRNPSVRRALGLRPQLGLESFLQGEAGLDETCIHLENPNLDVYPALVAQRNAHELLVTSVFDSMIRQLQSRYRVIILDTPPCLMLPDASLILRQVETCSVVVRAGESRVGRLRDALDALPSERTLGTILNCASLPSHRRQYDYYQTEADDDLPEPEES